MEVPESKNNFRSVETSAALGESFLVQGHLSVEVVVQVATDGELHDEAETVLRLEGVCQLLNHFTD